MRQVALSSERALAAERDEAAFLELSELENAERQVATLENYAQHAAWGAEATVQGASALRSGCEGIRSALSSASQF